MPSVKRSRAVFRQVGARKKTRPAIPMGLVRTGGRLPFSKTEQKNIDVSLDATGRFPTGTTTGQVLLLNGCIQGSAATNRLGRRITMKSLLLRMSVAMAATTTGSTTLRVMVVYDKQTNATALTAAQVQAVNNVGGLRLLDNVRRFKTLIDKTYKLSVQDPVANIMVYKKLTLDTEFNTGNAGTVGDITTGSIYLITFNNGSLATANPTEYGNTRIRFVDQ